jgi:hypothetical protein
MDTETTTIDKDTIISIAIQAAGTNEYEFYNRRTNASHMARLCCYAYYYKKGLTHYEISLLVRKKRISITQSLNRFSDRYKYDPRFKYVYDRFCEMVNQI